MSISIEVTGTDIGKAAGWYQAEEGEPLSELTNLIRDQEDIKEHLQITIGGEVIPDDTRVTKRLESRTLHLTRVTYPTETV